VGETAVLLVVTVLDITEMSLVSLEFVVVCGEPRLPEKKVLVLHGELMDDVMPNILHGSIDDVLFVVCVLIAERIPMERAFILLLEDAAATDEDISNNNIWLMRMSCRHGL